MIDAFKIPNRTENNVLIVDITGLCLTMTILLRQHDALFYVF